MTKMAEWHLDELRQSLDRNHWRLEAELVGDDYMNSGVWRITRPDGSNPVHIEFEGLDDLEVLPIAKAYACRVKEAPELSLYFRRPGNDWKTNLDAFVKSLDRVAT